MTERRTGAYVVSTDSFTAQELALLRSVLLNNFTIESTQVDNGKGKDQYSIDIPKREVPKLKERRAAAIGTPPLVKPYIPSSMAYRVGLSSFSTGESYSGASP